MQARMEISTAKTPAETGANMRVEATGTRWRVRLHRTGPVSLPKAPVSRASRRHKLRSNGPEIGRRLLHRKRTAATGLRKQGVNWTEKPLPAETVSVALPNNASMSAAAAGRAAAVVVGQEVADAWADAEGSQKISSLHTFLASDHSNPKGGSMKLIRWVAPAVLVLAGIASAQDVRYNYDKSADFTKYKTYKWVDMKASDKDAMVDSQIKSTIDAELATKGLTKSDRDDADLYVGYQVAINTEKQVNTFSSDFGYGGGWGYYGRGYGGMGSTTSTSTTSTLYVGSLQLDFYDVTKKQAVFRAVGTKTLDPKAKPEKRQKNLAKAIKKMLKDYPPKPKA